MEIECYKAFYDDMTNRFNEKYEVGKIYTCSGMSIFGKKGFHMCKRLEDTLRYYNSFDGKIAICKVIGSGNIVSREDDYYGYYDMYSAEIMEILKQLSRDEIIEAAYQMKSERLIRFIEGFKLNEEEITLFESRNDIVVNKYLNYYQRGKKNAFY